MAYINKLETLPPIKYQGKYDCISCALTVIDHLGTGEVYGLPLDFNPHDENGEPRIVSPYTNRTIDSHYWAFINNRYLVDVWMGEIFDLRDPEQLGIVMHDYGDPHTWIKLPNSEKRKYTHPTEPLEQTPVEQAL